MQPSYLHYLHYLAHLICTIYNIQPPYLHYLQYLATLFALFTLSSYLTCTIYTIQPTLLALFTLSSHLICTICIIYHKIHAPKIQGRVFCRKKSPCGMSLDHGVVGWCVPGTPKQGGTPSGTKWESPKNKSLSQMGISNQRAFPNLSMMELCKYIITWKSAFSQKSGI